MKTTFQVTLGEKVIANGEGSVSDPIEAILATITALATILERAREGILKGEVLTETAKSKDPKS